MSQGRKLKTGGRGSGGRGGRDNEHPKWGINKPKSGLFSLPKDATATTTNNWLEAIKDWGNVELQHGVGELARPHQPGVINQPNAPVRPSHDALDDNDNFIYAHAGEDLFADGGELTARGMALYKEDFDIYKQRQSEHDRVIREIDSAKLKLHGKLEAQLTLDAKTELERKYGSEIWTNKDPVALIDGIKTIFVGQMVGGGEGNMSRASLYGELHSIRKAPGESQLAFSRRFYDTVESYRHAELLAEREAEDIEAELSDQTLTRLYILGCGLNEWTWSLTYEPGKEPWPESLEAAIKRAGDIEEGATKKKKNNFNVIGNPSQQYEMFQAFLVHQQQQTPGKGKGNGLQRVPDKSEKKPGPCHSFHKTGTCQWTQKHPGGEPCRYTHDTHQSSVTSTNVSNMTSAAVAQVNQKSVGFDPNSIAGGGGTGVHTVNNTVPSKKAGNA